MKLSVSAFQASCSASAQKILQQHAAQHNYGSTSSSTAALQPSLAQQSTPPAHHLARRPNPVFKVEEVEGTCSSPSPPPASHTSHHHHQQQHSSSGTPGLAGPSRGSLSRRVTRPVTGMVDSTGVGVSASPSGGAGGTSSSRTGGGESSVEDAASAASSRSISQEDRSGLSSALPSLGTSREEEAHSEGHASDMSDRSSSNTGTRGPRGAPPPLDRSKSMGERQWANVRAVMALYSRLRRIKRTKSNQRWMKLRTTVQLSGAISSTIQKKPPLKREDSFLKRFSTRQMPEQQETLDDPGDDSDGGTGSVGGLMSKCAAKARRRKKIAQEKRSVVNPDENFYFYWLMVLTGCVLYNLWTLIVRQSFPELQKNIQPYWFTCDAFTDVIYFIDIVVQFRTGYLEQGLMVYNSKKLAAHYMHSRAFLLDISSLLPLDLLQFNIGINPILRFPRFLKVYRIYDYYYMVESRTVYPNLWRVVNLVHILLILAHWFGCFYFLLSEAEGFQGEWVYPYRPGDYATLTRKYLGSLYWSTLTLTTIGDLPTPETNAEYIFTIVSYLIGVFIFATIVGQVGNVITNRNANRLEFERLLDGAKTYMRHHKVPGDMKRRVLRWYDYSWSRGRIQGGGDINTALGLLPDKLKTELALHVNLSVLKKVTIFQECQPEFLHDLVLKMKAYIFTPGDLICRKGEVAREMFIIADGILEVISETGRVLTTMKAGDFFGEIGILNLDGLNKRTADVRSVGYSELFSLSREDVLAAMKDYPEAQEILQSLGRKRLMEARNVNKGGKVGSCKRRVSGAEHLGGTAGDSSDSTGKRIVDKLRSDVKGLKNVLRKSRRSGSRSSKEDSMEMQPLTSHEQPPHQPKPPRIKKLLLRSINVESSTSHESTGSASGRGHMLRRMGRVNSDEDHEHHVTSHHSAGHSSGQGHSGQEVIGAGLPLLQRLLLLKAKEDREEKARDEQAQMHCKVASPPHASPAPVTTAPTASAAPSAPGEVLGAGLPLMQRLRMLKQREDTEAKHKAAAKSASLPLKPPSPTPKIPILSPLVSEKKSSTESTTPQTLSPPSSAEVPKSRPWPLLNKKSNESAESVKSPPKISSPIKNEIITKSESVTPQLVISPLGEPPPYDLPISPPSNTSISPPPSLTPPIKSPSLTPPIKSPIIVTTPPLLSPPAITSPLSITSPISVASPMSVTSPPSITSPTSITSPPLSSSSSGSQRSPKPNLLRIQQDTKFYQSVDDLSPEYSGLPFVKKLKILNERQKLAELEETVSSTSIRSSSLDSGNNFPLQSELTPMTRSKSETCDIDYVQRTREINNTSSIKNHNNITAEEIESLRSESPETPPSPGCNETLERRNLKSILKKLSSSTSEEQTVETVNPVAIAKSKIEFRKLLRAQTVEGYAARHSKFAKSVTFNRETLSPPNELETAMEDSLPSLQQNATSRNKMNFLLPSLLLPSHSQELRKEEEFFGEIISGMKTVIQNHLEEIQNKFQKRFQSLELEVRRRDEIISQLQSRIQELEGTTVDNEVDGEARGRGAGGGSEDGDISDQDETNSDQPFMVRARVKVLRPKRPRRPPKSRGDSVDTVVTPSSSPIPMDSSDDDDDDNNVRRRSGARLENRMSWENHSEEESMELLDLPRSISPQSLWHITLDVPPSSSSSSSSSSPLSSPPVHNQDWEVQMLAEEMDRRDQRQKLEGELAELTGKSRLSKSELDILDQVLLESLHEKTHDRKHKNLSFDDDHIPINKKLKRKRTSSESVRHTSKSHEHLLIRDHNLRASLLRNRLHNKKQNDDENKSSTSSGFVSWLHRKSSGGGGGSQQHIGRQVLNAGSLEEPSITTVEKTIPTQSRSSSISHLPINPPPPPPPPTRGGSLFNFSRLRLSTLSHSIRGFSRPSSTPAVPSTDPERAVATISQASPSQQS